MAPSPPSPADFEAVFRATTSPLLVLGTDLVILEANRACEEATFRERDEVVGRHVFDAYPADPNDPDADGVRNLSALFRRVLESGEAAALHVQRYDVPFRGSPTGFREKYWSPVSSPALDPDGEVTALLHHVEDVTGFHEEPARVERAHRRTDTPTARTHTAVARRGCERHLAQAAYDLRRYRELEEAARLRRAMSTRATIDQAIGQRTNTKLRDIAAGLVRLAATDPPGPLLPDVP
ncbi:PAS domain-containing protein [Streptomyces sp. DH37]|uniref:PAS domain-containing protein n=1 Tax=Streptomyces sp. DH37 TaxID=3040122 RepID=UPI00244217B2|nr:PAS domain-containing protein [Streptomyces sp. DH37]MDG9706367.1 PAS domain-containing protein [Streptomyces sp. DH37]